MALVAMTCPNCNGPMEPEKSYFKCTHCQTIMLNIIDAKIDEDVTVMTPDEFAKKLEESKRSFVINLNDNLQEFDVNTLVTNKKIKDAYALLGEGKFDKVRDALNGVGDRILSAERLRYLASYKVQDEYELSYIDGYVDGYNYKNLISLCDEETKKTYQKIESYTRERHDTKVAIETEIKEADKLFEVELYEEAIAYTKEMCRKYPQTALSWSYACEAKARAGRTDYDHEYGKMKMCDGWQRTQPKTVCEKIDSCKQDAKRNAGLEEDLVKPRAAHSGITIGFLAVIALIVLFTTNGGIEYPFETLMMIVFIPGAIALLVCSISYFVREVYPLIKRIEKKNAFVEAWKEKLPNSIVDEIACEFTTCKVAGVNILLDVLVTLAFVGVVIFIIARATGAVT